MSACTGPISLPLTPSAQQPESAPAGATAATAATVPTPASSVAFAPESVTLALESVVDGLAAPLLSLRPAMAATASCGGKGGHDSHGC
ncbi:MAG: hypothetical protein R3E79_60320 [Caldilineaceae bacterium]